MEDTRSPVSQIAKLFGLTEQSPLFQQAVTHPSFAHEVADAQHNQRLEFLGDAILDFVVSEQLYERLPDADEGMLTRTRAQIVSTPALGRYARHVDVAVALRFGKGAAQGNLSSSDNVLADAVEALVAASYLEGGLAAARPACTAIMEFGLSVIDVAGARDKKSELQEEVQALGMKAPVYQVSRIDGPAHDALFEVHVLVQNVLVGTGQGRSKRSAEREAAGDALSRGSYREFVSEAEA